MNKVHNFNCSRRDALKTAVAAAFGLASARLGWASQGKELPRLTDANPAAASLEYTEDTNNVDARKFPKHTAAQRCANCKYFEVAAMSGGPYAPCKLYPGNEVNVNGWCAGYVAK
jgi:hypothetical protein